MHPVADGYESIRALSFGRAYFGYCLRTRMEMERIEYRTLAKLLGINRMTLRRIAQGQTEPSATYLMRLNEWMHRTKPKKGVTRAEHAERDQGRRKQTSRPR